MGIPQRIARMNELLKEEVGLLIHDEMKDPRVGFATVTAVETSPDLKNATVFVSVLGNDEEKDQTLEAVTRARGFIQGELGKRLKLKYTPSLKFERDDSADASMRIAKILEKIHEQEEKSEHTET